MLAAIQDRLEADGVLMGYLLGGVYLAQEVERISPRNTPLAYDANKELLPTAIILEETITPFGAPYQTARSFVTIWFYQRFAYANITPARKRTYALLHRKTLIAVNGANAYQVLHSDDMVNSVDEDLGAMEMSRYAVHLNRENE